MILSRKLIQIYLHYITFLQLLHRPIGVLKCGIERISNVYKMAQYESERHEGKTRAKDKSHRLTYRFSETIKLIHGAAVCDNLQAVALRARHKLCLVHI